MFRVAEANRVITVTGWRNYVEIGLEGDEYYPYLTTVTPLFKRTIV